MNFLARFGRSYASKSDLDERFEIFADNYASIELHNSTPDVTYRQGVNQFTDQTEQEIMARYNQSALKTPVAMHQRSTEVKRLH